MNNIRHFFNSRNIVRIAITAAAYVALTIILAPFGYGMVQCRLSEALCLLAFVDPVYGVGVTLGCFFANIASPFGLIDIAVGTFATFLSVVFISKSKSLLLASLWPSVCNILVAGMISYMTNVNFFVTAFFIMISEFIVVTIIGVPVFTYIIKNPKLYYLLKPGLNMPK